MEEDIQDQMLVSFPNKDIHSDNTRAYFQEWDNLDKVNQLIKIVKSM
jgi:hypothetical protein